MASLTIGEVARRAGVKATAIRYWEGEGVLPPPPRVGGQRRYDGTVLARLAVIRLAQEAGFSIADVRALVEGFDEAGVAPERWRLLAERKLGEIDTLIARARRMRRLLEESLGCGCVTLDTCRLVLDERWTATPAPGSLDRDRGDGGGGASNPRRAVPTDRRGHCIDNRRYYE